MTTRSPQANSVGLVVPAFDKGGLEQVVLNLYNQIRSCGISCVILVQNNEAGYMSTLVDDEDVYIFNNDESHFLAKCLDRRVCVLSYHYSTFLLSEMSALGILTTYTIHNIYTWLDDEAFGIRAAEICTANAVVAVSNFVKDYFCRRAKLSFERVTVIPNGVELSVGSGAEKAFLPLRQSAGGERVNFVLIASFHRNKHHLLAIAAAEALANQEKNFSLYLIGNVGDPTYFSEVQAAIGRSPAAQFITIVDYLDREAIFDVYKNVADVVLLVSLQEGCSNVLLEALAFGVPIIATDVGNARDAARIYNDIRIIERAYESVVSLNAGEVDRLSRIGRARNIEALCEAMASQMEGRLGPKSVFEEVRDFVSIGRMAAGYFELFAACSLAPDIPRLLGNRRHPAASG